MPVKQAQPVEEPVDTIEAYRIERFESMGFTTVEAQRLAKARDKSVKTVDKLGMPIWPGRVQKLLEAGCGHVMAVRIFAD